MYTFWYMHVLYAVTVPKLIVSGELIRLPTGSYVRVVQVYEDEKRLDAVFQMSAPSEDDTIYEAVFHVEQPA